jgi:hypothetical protein
MFGMMASRIRKVEEILNLTIGCLFFMDPRGRGVKNGSNIIYINSQNNNPI